MWSRLIDIYNAQATPAQCDSNYLTLEKRVHHPSQVLAVTDLTQSVVFSMDEGTYVSDFIVASIYLDIFK